jgi:ribosomal protein S12 methylthiotransferase
MSKKLFSIISLGCFRNNYDSEIVAERFLQRGYTLSLTPDLSDSKEAINRHCQTLIINTCGFIDKAREESLGVIKEAVKLKAQGTIKKLLVFGCLVEKLGGELKKTFPQVDEWWGIEEFGQRASRRAKLLPSHIDFLKICEGCFNKCSYCSIPFIKGPLKSRPAGEILKEAKFLDESGVHELNVIGQDITSWGKDLRNGHDLTWLVSQILKATKNIRWIRLLYTHPRHLDDSLLDLIAHEEKICKYIDLPLQHINDRILKLMNRKITKREIIRLVEKIRKKIPDAVIRTSLIVGFPTETEKEFKELISFVKETQFERLGAFMYSREEQTAAYNFSPQLAARIKMERFRRLMSLQRRIAAKTNKRFLGRTLDVLIEEKDSDVFVGRTQYDAYEVDGIVFVKKEGLKIGSFYRAKITDTYEYDLVGV